METTMEYSKVHHRFWKDKPFPPSTNPNDKSRSQKKVPFTLTRNVSSATLWVV